MNLFDGIVQLSMIAISVAILFRYGFLNLATVGCLATTLVTYQSLLVYLRGICVTPMAFVTAAAAAWTLGAALILCVMACARGDRYLELLVSLLMNQALENILRGVLNVFDTASTRGSMTQSMQIPDALIRDSALWHVLPLTCFLFLFRKFERDSILEERMACASENRELQRDWLKRQFLIPLSFYAALPLLLASISATHLGGVRYSPNMLDSRVWTAYWIALLACLLPEIARRRMLTNPAHKFLGIMRLRLFWAVAFSLLYLGIDRLTLSIRQSWRMPSDFALLANALFAVVAMICARQTQLKRFRSL